MIEHAQLSKSATGIDGLDAITEGGLPTGRPTLLCGAAGCGKTLFGVTFLVQGAVRFKQPGVLMTFEERPDDISANVESLGYDLPGLIASKSLAIDQVRIERGESEESGDYDLEGLFVRLGHAIDSIGAKRVVLDTIENLFGGLSDATVLRSELRRLFAWLKEKGVTAIITGERGEGQLTRHGLEEYVSDCVVLLDNRVQNQITTRLLRVVKYRGSTHGTNEYPFLIDHQGISVLPITSAGLRHQTSNEPVPTGVQGLDDMLGAGGYYKGSSVLISGTSGSGKTIFGSHFADATCSRGERCLYFAFEESPGQIVRNVLSVGLDLQKHLDSGLLRFEAARPTLYGFEMHLARMNRDLDEFKPATTIIDPISAFRGPESEVHSVLLRMVDILKTKGITAVMTQLTCEHERMASGDQGIPSLIDTWVALGALEAGGERNRGVYVLKSRGMGHSNQVREYQITNKGIQLLDVYRSVDGVLVGSARRQAQALQQKKSRGKTNGKTALKPASKERRGQGKSR
jgi:circadian clock protein KaiC